MMVHSIFARDFHGTPLSQEQDAVCAKMSVPSSATPTFDDVVAHTRRLCSQVDEAAYSLTQTFCSLLLPLLPLLHV